MINYVYFHVNINYNNILKEKGTIKVYSVYQKFCCLNFQTKTLKIRVQAHEFVIIEGFCMLIDEW